MIASGLLVNGCKVFICSRKQDAVAAAVESLNKIRPGAAFGIAVDLAKESGCKELVDFVAKHEQKVHILVNNAGCNWAAPLSEFPDSAFDKVMTLNVKAVFHCTRLFVPLMQSCVALSSSRLPAPCFSFMPRPRAEVDVCLLLFHSREFVCIAVYLALFVLCFRP
jgi:NAD(P)-dependent dehydrogenase (short-subunit alcohol dehydrogenase family)